MTTHSDGEDPDGPPEPTIADVMNAFSLDSGRNPKRRRWGRHRPDERQPRHEQAQRPGAAVGGHAGDVYADHDRDDGYLDGRHTGEGYPGGRLGGDRHSGDRGFVAPSIDRNDSGTPEAAGSSGFGAAPHRDEWDDIEASGASTFVRPYAWTRGRTRTGYSLEIETLVTTSQRGREQLALLQLEHRAVADLCQQARSVAEVAALLKVPLGVAKVLVGDMAGIGLVAVHESVGTHGDMPDLALMERVLSGLRRL
jgi:hypothetical protein